MLAFAVLLAACARKPDWQEFVSREGGFSASFPAAPKSEVQNIQTPEGAVQLHQTMATFGQRAYLVTYNDYPQGEDQVPANVRLQGWRSGVLQGRTVVRERDVTLDGVPGREMELDTTEGVRLTTRAFFRGKRLFQAVVAAPKDDLAPDDAARFLDSFKLMAGR